jgi:DNA-binding GntR family transcriptional regulator
MLHGMQEGGGSVVKVVSALTELILTGQLPAGAPVREAELAERLEVSRTPVREGIAQLVARGLLTKENGRSARVHQPSLEDLVEIYELRSLTESHLAARAAEKVDAATLARLADLEEKLRTTSGDEWFEHHADFHGTILEAAGRPRFIALANNLKDQSEPYVRLVTKLDESLRGRSSDEHAQLLAAMRAHDPQSARAITAAHLESTVQSVDRIYTAARALFVPLGFPRAESHPAGG